MFLSFENWNAYAEGKLLNVIVETPKGSQNKYGFKPTQGVMHLDKILPSGSAFPLDFGFVPGTLAEDGDPLDVLLLADAPCIPCCWVIARVLGIMQAEQKDKGGQRVRNDRLIAAAVASRTYADFKSMADLPESLIKELGEFFKNYHALLGNEFEVLGYQDVDAAHKAIQVSIEKARTG